MRRSLARAAAALGIATVLVAPFAVIAVAAPQPTPDRVGSLTAVGPVSGDHGFPVWYQDSTLYNGKPLRLEGCLDPADANCPMIDPVPDPDAPVDIRTGNFPIEFFYQVGQSVLPLGTAGQAVLTLGLEGAWANEIVRSGDQVVFGRVRIVVKDAAPNTEYLFKHPWGVDTLTTDATGSGKEVEDVGVAPGIFTGALGSRVGPFLRWSAQGQQPPAGYVAVGGILHTITGSGIKDETGAFQDYFRAIAPGTDVRQTLFDLTGKIASNSGVTPQQTTYSTSAAGDSALEVFATSDPGAAIQVHDVAPATRFSRTVLAGDSGGRYYGRLAVTGKPASVDVVNVGDTPVTRKTVKVVDRVTVTKATYAFDAARNTGTLAVAAVSSDEATPPALAVSGFGPLGTDGSATFADVVAPPVLTVTSAAGGSATVPVATSGDLIAPERPTASAGANQVVQQGDVVQLDAALSAGDITAYRWEQLTTGTGPTVTLSDPTAVAPTFTAPAEPGDLVFGVTVTGPGGSSTAQVTVTVEATQPALVRVAQTAISAQRGTTVTLDASASKGVSTYSWTRVSGPGVTLRGADTAKPTIVVPLRRLPGQGAVANTATDLGAIVMQLDASGPGGTADPVTVTITPQNDAVTVASAEFRAKTSDWRISGTSSVPAGQRIAVVLGSSATGTLIGYANVDATGAWTYRGTTTAAPATNVTTVSAISALGGQRMGFTFRRK